jgi:signal transduction histidine kinase
VLDNLISNAIKYSTFGKKVYIRLLQTQQSVRCEIQDEGPGLSKKDHQKLFGKFARLSARPTGGEHSTGLGLFIVKKLVTAMDGQVWCESELGKGATFVIEFVRAT